MNYPVFVFHELTYRLSEISPEIGAYDSSVTKDGNYVIHTTNGELEVDSETIAKQYKNPKLLSKDDMLLLSQKFHARNKQEFTSKV